MLNSNSTNKPNTHYDYIIAGGSIEGCLSCARLLEKYSNIKILLLEKLDNFGGKHRSFDHDHFLNHQNTSDSATTSTNYIFDLGFGYNLIPGQYKKLLDHYLINDQDQDIYKLENFGLFRRNNLIKFSLSELTSSHIIKEFNHPITIKSFEYFQDFIKTISSIYNSIDQTTLISNYSSPISDINHLCNNLANQDLFQSNYITSISHFFGDQIPIKSNALKKLLQLGINIA